MHRRGLFRAAVLAAGIVAIGWTGPATAAAAGESYRLTGPYAHDNLAIYLIHREGQNDRPVPLTLGEAMEQELVEVIETGDVQELVIRNLGEREVFIQSGDIVKGGKQDRVLIVSMIIPPNSGDIPVGAFCVERGRWSDAVRRKWLNFRHPQHACRRRPPGLRSPSGCSARSCRKPAVLHRSPGNGSAWKMQAFRAGCGIRFARCR